jgi:hypothetical protein
MIGGVFGDSFGWQLNMIDTRASDCWAYISYT